MGGQQANNETMHEAANIKISDDNGKKVAFLPPQTRKGTHCISDAGLPEVDVDCPVTSPSEVLHFAKTLYADQRQIVVMMRATYLTPGADSLDRILVAVLNPSDNETPLVLGFGHDRLQNPSSQSVLDSR